MKRCPICDELIEEHLQVCPYCDEETGFEPKTISKRCPICGELIDETFKVCPICGEDITPQTYSEHAHHVLESVVEVPELVKDSEIESAPEIIPKLVDEPQPEPTLAPEPIVEESELVQGPEQELEPAHTPKPIAEKPTPVQEPKPIVVPQPEMVSKVEPDPKVCPIPPTVSKADSHIIVPEEPQKYIPISSWKKNSPLLYVIIVLLVIIIALLLISILKSPKSEKEDKSEITQTEVVKEKQLTIPELLDSIAKMLPSGGQLIARFPDEARHCLYYLADKSLYCYDAEKNMSDPISVMHEGFEADILSAQLMEDGSTILLKVEDINGKELSRKLDTNTKNIMEVVISKGIEKREPIKDKKTSVKKVPKRQTKRKTMEEPELPAKGTGFRLERVDKIPHSN